MAITMSGRTFRTLDDELYLNGKRIAMAHVNDTLVYPEGSYIARLDGSIHADGTHSHVESSTDRVCRKSVDISASVDIRFAVIMETIGAPPTISSSEIATSDYSVTGDASDGSLESISNAFPDVFGRRNFIVATNSSPKSGTFFIDGRNASIGGATTKYSLDSLFDVTNLSNKYVTAIVEVSATGLGETCDCYICKEYSQKIDGRSATMYGTQHTSYAEDPTSILLTTVSTSGSARTGGGFVPYESDYIQYSASPGRNGIYVAVRMQALIERVYTVAQSYMGTPVQIHETESRTNTRYILVASAPYTSISYVGPTEEAPQDIFTL